MSLRRILSQVGVLAGATTCGIILWLEISRGNMELISLSLRAVGIGIAVVVLAMVIGLVFEKLSNQPSED